MPDIPVFIINLERDVDRHREILSQFENRPGFSPLLVTAVAGNTLPDQVVLALTESPIWVKQKGAVGCTLSHVRAWEQIARLEVPFAVVVEDDAETSRLEALHRLTFPADMAFVFINDRMSAQWEETELRVTGIVESLLRKDIDRVRVGHVDRDGFGTDGYILTPAGAAKLLVAYQRDLYGGHVDGRLLRYVTAPEELESLPDESWVKGIITHHHNQARLPELGLLKGYSLSSPLVWHRIMPSSREASNVL